MRRRDLLVAVLGGASAASPLVARAQHSEVPVVGFISAVSARINSEPLDAFRHSLMDAGYDEGRNILIEYRWAEGRFDRLPALTAELVSRPVNVICAATLPAALAAKTATSTIPIVFSVGADPVKFGLVASFSRPGGNATGIFQYIGPLAGKRLELLRELVPRASKVAVLSNSTNQNAETNLTDIEGAARAMGQGLKLLRASTDTELDVAFANFVSERADALLVADDPFFTTRIPQLVALAARHQVPAIYYQREFVASGGLISYGSSPTENYREAGTYVARILKGATPSDLPVLQPTKFELAINLKTAKALGLTTPPTLLARADEVIE